MLKTSYYISLLALVLGQFSLVYGAPGSGIYAFDIFIILFDLLGFTYFLSIKKSFKIPFASFFYIIFAILAGLSLIVSLPVFNFYDIGIGILYLARFVTYVFSGLVIYNIVKNEMLSREELFSSIVFSGVLLSLGGILQLFLLPDFETLDPLLGWDPHKNRLASTFFDPNFTGAYLSICLILLFDKYYSIKRFTFRDFLFFTIILISVFLTFSRSAWATLAVIIFIYGWFKSKSLFYVSLLVVFCAYFAVPRVQTRIMGATDPADSARLRIESWQKAGKVIDRGGFFGVGYNNYKLAQKHYGFLSEDELSSHSASGTDSSLLLVLATTGVPGLLIYLLAFISPAFRNRKMNLLPLALISGLFVNSLFINSLFFPQIMFLMFSIVMTE